MAENGDHLVLAVTLKERPRMVKTHFIADTHFGHGNIIKYCNRPFLMDVDRQALEENGGKWHNGTWKGNRASKWQMSKGAVDLMDTTMINNINELVGQDDILWHCGDFAMPGKDGYVSKCEAYRNRIVCRNVNILWGNHDHPYQIRHLFNEAHFLHRISTRTASIILCHYALATWEGSHRGSMMLYGHSHTTAEPWLEAHMPGRKSMDVGVDNAYKLFGKFRPFSLEEIIGLLGKRTGFSMDHGIPKNSNAPSEEDLS